jgi:hypothetical protein
VTAIAAFLLKYWKGASLVLLAVVVTCELQQWHAAAIGRGQAMERARQQDSVIAVLSKQSAKVETLFVHDSVRLTRLAVRYDTLRDTVLAHLTDTVLVKQFIAATDSGKRACVETANDCAAFRLSANQEIATLRAEAHPAPILVFQPTFKQKAGYALLGAMLGEAARFAATRRP